MCGMLLLLCCVPTHRHRRASRSTHNSHAMNRSAEFESSSPPPFHPLAPHIYCQCAGLRKLRFGYIERRASSRVVSKTHSLVTSKKEPHNSGRGFHQTAVLCAADEHSQFFRQARPITSTLGTLKSCNNTHWCDRRNHPMLSWSVYRQQKKIKTNIRLARTMERQSPVENTMRSWWNSKCVYTAGRHGTNCRKVFGPQIVCGARDSVWPKLWPRILRAKHVNWGRRPIENWLERLKNRQF